MRNTIHSFWNDQRGLAAEFALVLPLLLLLMLGTIDVGNYAWRINQAEKATQLGARFAAVTNPVAQELLTASYVGQTVGGTTILQGDRIPAAALGTITCTSTTCSCSGSCPGNTFDSAAFNALAARMRVAMPTLQNANIIVEYSGSGLGFAGDPNGPDISPIITVRLQNLSYTPITLSPIGTTVNLPDFAYSLTAEDASGSSSF
jgi:Flp pilus assembly protein TadG